jgi:hypothetical protein
VSEPYEPGVHDIPEADYFGASYALSCSGAKLLLPPSCPAKFFYRQDHPEYKAVWDFGSAAHQLVLGSGPEIVECEFPDWRTKDAKQQQAEARAAGKTPLLSKDLAVVRAMAAAIEAHPVAGYLFDPYDGMPEQSVFWQDERTGIMRRARLDWLPGLRGDRLVIVDLKTCDAADPDSIAKSVERYSYHMQHAFYVDGVAAVLGVMPEFIFCFIEKQPPYLINVVQLIPDAVRIGRALVNKAIDEYRTCISLGDWPGYEDDEITEIALPAWARTGEDY